MGNKNITPGALHDIPKDLEEILISKSDILELWNSLTSLARNEWICWVTIVKKVENQKGTPQKTL